LTLGLSIYLAHALVDFDWEFVAVTGPTLFVAGLLAAAGTQVLAPGRRLVPSGIAVVATLAALYSLGAPWLAGRRVDESYAALDGNDVATAVSKARSAHRLNPLSYQPYWALAGAALVAGDESAARVNYEEAAILQPENSETWFVLGQYEYRTGRFARACYALDLAYRLDPRGPPGKPGGLLDRVKKRLPGCPGSTPPP
jgi:cytochrome c-type biogenesis protein CcmH/NrfG